MDETDLLARAAASLRALAVGDAMGRATELYAPAEIEEIYEDAVTEFIEPIRLFDDEGWAAAETGPPTARALALIDAGTTDTAQQGVAALPAAVAVGLMRPLPRVLASPPSDAAIAALAAAVSAGIDGHPTREALAWAARAAEAAHDADLAARILAAAGLAQASGGRRAGAALRADFPPDGGTASLVPFILGVAYATQSARRAILEAVNQGGHAPESAGLAGAVCAAFVPLSLPPAWAAEVERVNDLDLEAAAHRCVRLRAANR